MSCVNLLPDRLVFRAQVYDRVLPAGRADPDRPDRLAAGLYAAQGGLDLLRGRILGRIGTSLDRAIRTRVFDTIVRLLVAKQPQRGLQPLRDLDNVRSFLGSMGPGAFFDLLAAVLPGVCFVPLASRPDRGVRRHHSGDDADYRVHVAHAGPQAMTLAAQQRSSRHQPAQRRSAGRDGNVRAPGQMLEQANEAYLAQSARQRVAVAMAPSPRYCR